jgi:hypothetical protein
MPECRCYPHEHRLSFMRCRRMLKTLKSASAESALRHSTNHGVVRLILVSRPRHVANPTKVQSISPSSRWSNHVVPRARKAPVVTFDTSTAGGRTSILLSTLSTADRKLCGFWVGPRFYMGLTGNENRISAGLLSLG